MEREVNGWRGAGVVWLNEVGSGEGSATLARYH